ncbi:unnamed protein product [Amoebophrya sp. A25]|nr:unnamed protein product [Amoebophrya sp. A25]|eukprot:GSA25T00007354001.1
MDDTEGRHLLPRFSKRSSGCSCISINLLRWRRRCCKTDAHHTNTLKTQFHYNFEFNFSIIIQTDTLVFDTNNFYDHPLLLFYENISTLVLQLHRDPLFPAVVWILTTGRAEVISSLFRLDVPQIDRSIEDVVETSKI